MKSEQPLDPKVYHYIEQFFAQDQIPNIEYYTSGLKRIIIPVQGDEEYAEIRINYLGKEKNIMTCDNNLHDHRRLFVSYMMAGQYRHQIYQEKPIDGELINKQGQEIYYKIQMNHDNTSTKSIVGLELITKADFKQGDTKIYHQNIIHNIIDWIPGTISLNVVYKHFLNKSYFNFYLTEQQLGQEQGYSNSFRIVQDMEVYDEMKKAFNQWRAKQESCDIQRQDGQLMQDNEIQQL